MKPSILRKKSFIAVGLEIETTAQKLTADIAEVYKQAAQLDLDRLIQNRLDANQTLAFIQNWSDTEPFSFFLGAEVTRVDHLPPNCKALNVSDATYAVFDLIGTAPNITEPWSEIFAWFESSGEEWVIPMNFREYDDESQSGRIYMPISLG